MCQLGAELRRPQNKDVAKAFPLLLPAGILLASARALGLLGALPVPPGQRLMPCRQCGPTRERGCAGSRTGLAGEEQPEWVVLPVKKEGRTPKEREGEPV